MNRKEIEKMIIEKYIVLGSEFNLFSIVVQTERDVTSIYIKNTHALQLEINWRENTMFMYVVYLINGEIPQSNVLYQYNNGQWCRKYIEEIYGTNNPMYKSQNRKKREFLFDLLDYYMTLIRSNPSLLNNLLIE